MNPAERRLSSSVTDLLSYASISMPLTHGASTSVPLAEQPVWQPDVQTCRKEQRNKEKTRERREKKARRERRTRKKDESHYPL